MAFLPGLWGNKNTQAPAPAPAAAPVTVPNAAGPASKQPGVPNPGADPTNMQLPAPGAAPAPGPMPELDKFAELFKPRQVDPSAPKPVTLADPILAPLDQEAFRQQIATANFAAAIPADVLAKAAGGDPAALAQAINQASQAAFAAGTQLTHGLVEHGSRTAAERVDSQLGVKIRNQAIQMQNVDNQVLQHPAVAPLVGLVKNQIANQNPRMSPEQVTAATAEYFTNMTTALGQPAKLQAEAATAAEQQKSNFRFLLEP